MLYLSNIFHRTDALELSWMEKRDPAFLLRQKKKLQDAVDAYLTHTERSAAQLQPILKISARWVATRPLRKLRK